MAGRDPTKMLFKRDSYIFENGQVQRIVQLLRQSSFVGTEMVANSSPSHNKSYGSHKDCGPFRVAFLDPEDMTPRVPLPEQKGPEPTTSRHEVGDEKTPLMSQQSNMPEVEVDATSEELLADLKKELDTDTHRISLDDLYLRFQTHPQTGLTDDQVDSNLANYGANVLTPLKVTPEWVKFSKHLLGGFSLLMWIGSALCYAYMPNAPYNYYYLGIALASVVLISGLYAYYKKSKSSWIMDSFKKKVPQTANVIRNGFQGELDVADLVVGDIVEVKYGDRIPADIRIIESFGLKVDNSFLTGESEPQTRSVDCTHDNPMETKNLCFFSTSAIEGTGKGVVVNVGDRTLMGRIAGLASRLETTDTPIAKEMDHIVKVISTVAILLGLFFFIKSVVMGHSWLNSVVFLIGILMMNILYAYINYVMSLDRRRRWVNCVLSLQEV